MKFLEKIFKVNELYAIGIFKKEGPDSYYVLKVARKKTSLEVAGIYHFDSFEEMEKSIDHNIPALVIIDGKGILNKKIGMANDTDSKWVKNLDYGSIYYLDIVADEHNYISFCRRNILDETISLLQKSGIQPIDFYIGPTIASLLKKSLPQESLMSGETILEFEGEKLTGIKKSMEEGASRAYTIGKSGISNYHLPLYAASVDFFVGANFARKSSFDGIDLDSVIYKKAFNKIGIISIVAVFLLLLCSYVATQYYISENSELNLQNVYSNKSFKTIEDLELRKEKKIKILNETGFSSSRFFSYYAYELAKSAPAEIKFSTLRIFPLEKEIKHTQKAMFRSKTIVLQGVTADESRFDSWLESIRNYPWIAKSEIVSLKRDKKNITHFELKIILKDV